MLPPACKDDEVVHVPHIEVQAEGVLAILIESVEIDVCGFLRGEVAYRHADLVNPLFPWAVVGSHAYWQAKRHVRVIDDDGHQPEEPRVVGVVCIYFERHLMTTR